MDLIPVLSSVIVLATVATIILALVSYLAFKLRDRKGKPKNVEVPQFFRRYLPDGFVPRATQSSDDEGSTTVS